MVSKLLNPFVYLAGGKSLAYGVGLILLTSVSGYLCNIHFPDLLSVKYFEGVSFGLVLGESLVNWIVISSFLYLAALLFSKSSVRIIDIFGTQAIARAPYLLAALTGLPDTVKLFSDYILWEYLKIGEPVSLSLFGVVLAVLIILFVLLLSVWMFVLMFNAYRVSANLRGGVAGWSFTGVVLVSVVVTAWLNWILFLNIKIL